MTTLKNELREYIERLLRAEERNRDDYRDRYYKAIESGDNIDEHLANDLRHMHAGGALALRDVLDWLNVYGGLYEDGAERPLELEEKGGENER